MITDSCRDRVTAILPGQAEPPLVLTLDVGTSSVRAKLFDAQGQPLTDSTAQIEHGARTTADGGVEFDPLSLCARCLEAIDRMHARARELRLPVVAVALDTFVSNLMAIDSSGQPITPLYTYADTRSASALDVLRTQLDEPSTYRRVGVPIHTAYWPAQLSWLRAAERDMFKAAQRWLTFGDYWLQRLFGRPACTYSAASWTGLLDRFKLCWDAQMLQAIEIDENQLSPLVDSAFHFSGLSSSYATRWPLLKDVAWFPAMGDGVTANVGSGCVDSASAALTIGTTAALRIMLGGTPDKVPHGLWCYRVDGKRSLLGGALSEGGNLYQWLRDVLGLSSVHEDTLAALPPDGHRLTFLPMIAGERSPGWRADARAALTGLSLTTQPAEILLAGLEAVAYRLGLVWQLLLPHAPDCRRIVGSGGGLLASPFWMQTIADVLNQPLIASQEHEASSRGAALLVLEALGRLSLADVSYALGTIFEPDAQRHEIYTRARRRQQELYRKLYG